MAASSFTASRAEWNKGEGNGSGINASSYSHRVRSREVGVGSRYNYDCTTITTKTRVEKIVLVRAETAVVLRLLVLFCGIYASMV